MFPPLHTPDALNPAWAPGINISMVPLRKVVGRSSQVNNGWHRTNKHPDGYLPGESRPELALFLVLAEMDPNVTLVTAQPCEIPFSHDGKACAHFPDYAVLETGDSVLYEVKTARKYAETQITRRLAAACRSVEARGDWSYFVALDDEMRRDRRFKSAEELWRRHRPIFTKRQRLAVERAVGKGERPIADIVTDLAGMDDAPTVHTVLSLAANARLFIGLDEPIGRGSIVRRADSKALPEPLLPRRSPIEDLEQEIAA